MTESRERVRQRKADERAQRISENRCPQCGVAWDSPAPCGVKSPLNCPMITGEWQPWEEPKR